MIDQRQSFPDGIKCPYYCRLKHHSLANMFRPVNAALTPKMFWFYFNIFYMIPRFVYCVDSMHVYDRGKIHTLHFFDKT